MLPLEETRSEVVQSDLYTIVDLCYFVGIVLPLVELFHLSEHTDAVSAEYRSISKNKWLNNLSNLQIVFPVVWTDLSTSENITVMSTSLPFSGNIFLLVKHWCLIMYPHSKTSLLHLETGYSVVDIDLPITLRIILVHVKTIFSTSGNKFS